jgi:hypothetical protein
VTTVVEDAADIHRFQLVARPPARLALRLDIDDPERRRSVAHAVTKALSRYLAAQSLGNIEVVLDARRPVVDARSGKLRSVIADPATRER